MPREPARAGPASSSSGGVSIEMQSSHTRREFLLSMPTTCFPRPGPIFALHILQVRMVLPALPLPDQRAALRAVTRGARMTPSDPWTIKRKQPARPRGVTRAARPGEREHLAQDRLFL
jgi:hypothetical protein